MSQQETSKKYQNKSDNKSIYNHRFGVYSESLGIDTERTNEIKETVRAVTMRTENVAKTKSEKTEMILATGLNYLEVCFAMYMFSRFEKLGNELNGITSNPVIKQFGIDIDVLNIGDMFDQLFDKFNKNM